MLLENHKINFSFILPTADFRNQQSFGPGYCFIFISGILNRETVLTKIETNHLPSPDKLVDEVGNLSLRSNDGVEPKTSRSYASAALAIIAKPLLVLASSLFYWV